MRAGGERSWAAQVTAGSRWEWQPGPHTHLALPLEGGGLQQLRPAAARVGGVIGGLRPCARAQRLRPQQPLLSALLRPQLLAQRGCDDNVGCAAGAAAHRIMRCLPDASTACALACLRCQRRLQQRGQQRALLVLVLLLLVGRSRRRGLRVLRLLLVLGGRAVQASWGHAVDECVRQRGAHALEQQAAGVCLQVRDDDLGHGLCKIQLAPARRILLGSSRRRRGHRRHGRSGGHVAAAVAAHGVELHGCRRGQALAVAAALLLLWRRLLLLLLLLLVEQRSQRGAQAGELLLLLLCGRRRARLLLLASRITGAVDIKRAGRRRRRRWCGGARLRLQRVLLDQQRRQLLQRSHGHSCAWEGRRGARTVGRKGVAAVPQSLTSQAAGGQEWPQPLLRCARGALCWGCKPFRAAG